MNKLINTFDDFTVIEGPDATGKNTQSKLLAEAASARLTSFPRYSTDHGRIIKGLLHNKLRLLSLDAQNLSPEWVQSRMIQALMTWDRYDWVNEFHFLIACMPVVSDRYWMSGFVYGGIDGLEDEELIRVHKSLPQPDVAILLNVPLTDQMDRLKARNRDPDRYEKADGNLLARIYNRYMLLWEQIGPQYFPETMWAIVDGAGTQEEVHERVLAVTGTKKA